MALPTDNATPSVIPDRQTPGGGRPPNVTCLRAKELAWAKESQRDTRSGDSWCLELPGGVGGAGRGGIRTAGNAHPSPAAGPGLGEEHTKDPRPVGTLVSRQSPQRTTASTQRARRCHTGIGRTQAPVPFGLRTSPQEDLLLFPLLGDFSPIPIPKPPGSSLNLQTFPSSSTTLSQGLKWENPTLSLLKLKLKLCPLSGHFTSSKISPLPDSLSQGQPEPCSLCSLSPPELN